MDRSLTELLTTHAWTILTINSGSSSLKLGLYRVDAGTAEPQLLYRGATDAIGKPGGSLTVTDSDRQDHPPRRRLT